MSLRQKSQNKEAVFNNKQNNWHGNIFGVNYFLSQRCKLIILENSRKIIILNSWIFRTNLLSTIYLAGKQVGGGRLSNHSLQGSIIHTNHRVIIWYNHGINIRRLFMAVFIIRNFIIISSYKTVPLVLVIFEFVFVPLFSLVIVNIL